jgi:hypothetical protein
MDVTYDLLYFKCQDQITGASKQNSSCPMGLLFPGVSLSIFVDINLHNKVAKFNSLRKSYYTCMLLDD